MEACLVLWVVLLVLLVLLEEAHQVWQLEGELVHAELELECRDRDELLLLSVVLWLVVAAILVGDDTGNHGEEGKKDDDLHWKVEWFGLMRHCC